MNLCPDLKLSIFCSDKSVGGLAAPDRDVDTGKVVYRICINADMIWPLLLDIYTPAEKAAYHLYLAKVILHELVVSNRPPSQSFYPRI